MPEPTKTGGGAFDPNDRHVYFLASHSYDINIASRYYDHLLVPVNDVESATDERRFVGWLDQGKSVLLDSGIFTLASTHALIHGVSHDVALNLAPQDIDGFADLLARYVALVTHYGDRLWGYIELDQGGRENKIKTRAHLESLGLRPIPVYHPFGDGWDYFDYLAERYDRICLGNVVQANATTRLRLLATLAQRKRRHPRLWVHALGLTPNEVTFAYPPDSADSSSWLSAIRWSGMVERACGSTLGQLPSGFRYKPGVHASEPRGHERAREVSAYSAALGMQNWRDFQAERDAMEDARA